MKYYIAGPVTGVKEDNLPRFRVAQKLLESEGHEAIVPHDIVDASKTQEEIMRVCLEAVLRSDSIYMLPNWQRSRGACAELFVARTAGLSVRYYTNERFASSLVLESPLKKWDIR